MDDFIDAPTVIGDNRRKTEQHETETDDNHGSAPEMTKAR